VELCPKNNMERRPLPDGLDTGLLGERWGLLGQWRRRQRIAANAKGRFYADALLQVTQEGADDRVSGIHANRHGDIFDNGSSGVGDNADSAETADLDAVTDPAPSER
jgi:hypothetical protein